MNPSRVSPHGAFLVMCMAGLALLAAGAGLLAARGPDPGAVPTARQVYDRTMYILAGMLVVGLICNMLVKPLAPRWFMKPEDVVALQAKGAAANSGGGSYGIGESRKDCFSPLGNVTSTYLRSPSSR